MEKIPLVDTKASTCSCDYLPIIHPWVYVLDWLDWPIGETILRVRLLGVWESGAALGDLLPVDFVRVALLFTLCLIFPSFVLRVRRVLPQIRPQIREDRDLTPIIWYQSNGCHRFDFVSPQIPQFFLCFREIWNFSPKIAPICFWIGLWILCVWVSFDPQICC